MNNLPIMFEYVPGHWFNLCDILTIDAPAVENDEYLYHLKEQQVNIYVSKEQHETIIKFLQSYKQLNIEFLCDLISTKVLEYQRKYLDTYLKK